MCVCVCVCVCPVCVLARAPSACVRMLCAAGALNIYHIRGVKSACASFSLGIDLPGMLYFPRVTMTDQS